MANIKLELCSTIIKYLDVFGTKFTFDTNNGLKLYTLTGGILSIFSILACLLSFIFYSLHDFDRKYPLITISSIPSEGYRKIKFGKEKIWIPWRIVDYNNNEYVNHTGLLFPIIYYYSGIKEKNSKIFNLTSKLLSYKLCNETEMGNKSDIYQISIPLNELYCIDMEDLDMGGSWIHDYINYIEFDLYYCKDGINYNETNPKCSSFNKILNFLGEDNSLEISLYYPIVQFQPTNKTFPVIVIYKEYFYHISRYVYKINRLYLQENVLTDDSGWILQKETNHSYWGLNSMYGDTYFIGSQNDLMNEGSNSRAYSFNIYLEPGIIHYKRYYKKLQTIFSDFFPISYIIFIIMKIISKIFTMAERNKNITELLFENLKEKPIFEQISKLKLSNINNGRLSCNNIIKIKYQKLKLNENRLSPINKQKNQIKITSLILDNNNNMSINSNNEASQNITKSPLQKCFEQTNKNILINNSKQKLIYNEPPFSMLNRSRNIIDENNNELIKPKKRYIKEKLFPYKYYCYSVFIKNLDISKRNILFSIKFSKIYLFLCKLYDITSYLALQREFNAVKKILKEKKVNILDNYKKINVNCPNFIRDINDCIQNSKFHILAQGFIDK